MMHVVDAPQNDFLAVLPEPGVDSDPAEQDIVILENGRSLPEHKWERLAAYAQGMSKAPDFAGGASQRALS